MTKIKVLIVEDESIIAMHLQSQLEEIGYHAPFFVNSGEEAINKARKWYPDIVLMDILLNGRLDGIEAAAHIRSEYGFPVIFLTAYTEDHILERARLTGPSGFLIKPIETKELQAALQIALFDKVGTGVRI